MMLRLAAIRERLRSSLWFLPALFALGAIGLAFGVLGVDRQLDRDGTAFFLFGGTAEGARNVLSTIAQSMLTFTGLVFTITMLVLQLASSQLSPRVMRTFLRDRQNQVVLGLFVATFLYTLLILREVRSSGGVTEFVPGLSIFLAFVLLLASVAAFIFYIDHMAHAIRASTVIANIWDETRGAIERLFPEPIGREPEEEVDVDGLLRGRHAVLATASSGVVTNIDEETLMEVALELDTVIAMLPMIGDFVPEGGPLMRVYGREELDDDGDGQGDESLAKRLRSAVTIGRERTLQQDAAFGFRQLVDIGSRALSPGTNDPSTAVQAIDYLHDLLRRLADRKFPSPVRVDDDGRPRLVFDRPDWDHYVHLAVDELRLYGSGQIQVVRRLTTMLSDLEAVTPHDRRPILRDEFDRIRAGLETGFDLVRDRRTVLDAPSRGPERPA